MWPKRSFFSFQVAAVVMVGGKLVVHALGDPDAVFFKLGDLFGVVGHEAHALYP